MSLVNDMLRDLETRRAGPEERLPLSGLHAVDEIAASRRERYERIRRGSIWFAAVVLISVLVGLMLGRLVRGPAQPFPASASEPATVVVPAPAPAPAQVLEVLPQHDGSRFVLQLLLDRSVSYRRLEESGAVSLLLGDVQLAGEPQSGKVQRDGRSLSWRVENRGAAVQVLLVGLSGEIEASDRLERAGDRWQLWIEVPMAEPVESASFDPLSLPAAEPALEPEEQVPEWMSRPAPAREPAVAAEAAPVQAPPPPAPPRNPDLRISSHTPDALSLARQALQDGDHVRAIRELEALQRDRPADPEVSRWLARAYLADGRAQQLLDWAVPRLAANPHDSELRMLLARAQLQLGEKAAAIATLEQSPPPLARDSAYHALLAALYQQNGDWQRSANLYQQLVGLRPGQSTWQLGLGIALEQLGRDGDAARHYRLALQGSGLDEASRRFAGERAAALGGR